MPIDFIYDLRKNAYDLDAYEDDAALLAKVRTGRHDAVFNYVQIDNFYAATVPATIEQSPVTGENNIEKAKAVSFTYFVKGERNPDIDKKFYGAFEQQIIDAVEELNAKYTYIRIEMVTERGIRLAFSEDIQSDISVLGIAIVLVALYTILVLGTTSAMHCRLIVSILGLVCIGLAYASGFGLCYYLGGETAGVHQLMPFLLIGIGADDLFVICNALDQTNLNDPALKRVKEAMMHAGPSITITSLTNCLAFLFGGLASLLALRSFCIFAACSIFMLYLSVMTVFLAVVVWDTERVGRKKGECCGLCMCKMDSIFCCGGFFLSDKQKAYGSVQWPYPSEDKKSEKKDDENQKGATEDKAQAAPKQAYNSEEASKTEKCIYRYMAPCLLSTAGKIVTIVVYVALIAAAAYGCTQVEIDFKVNYFIGETSSVYGWFNLNDKYFSIGTETTTYVSDSSNDYASEKFQKEMIAFNAALEECEGCDEKWNMPNTLDSWFREMHKTASENGCQVSGTADDYIIEPSDFYNCLCKFIATDEGRGYAKDLIYTGVINPNPTLCTVELTGFRQTIVVKKIE